MLELCVGHDAMGADRGPVLEKRLSMEGECAERVVVVVVGGGGGGGEL